MGPGILGGIAGAAGAEIYEKGKAKVADAAGATTMDESAAKVHAVLEMIASIERMMREAQNVVSPRLFRIVQLTSTGWLDYNRRNYKYVYMAVTANITVNAMFEIGIVPLSMTAGWNKMVLPDRCQLQLSTGGPTNVLLCYSDEALI